ncbi:fructuronate reductase [Kibdelosporangium banguiense]|uniref:Mannitol-1-phosphate 5-dehydrogenase n=1 Tax=Kibdelosporangium banguiense TaxID=1365924 RepID=A0ABS4TQI5_9PSEU|nr:mannitol dehydrogenase family protein [Kibdelosporangium banguiense]MBP2326676.1 fructuronate reductase [Kibdelosporangium banguiense]
MLKPLSLATLNKVSKDSRPLIDRAELAPRVVHFGLGAFHRAHQAVYTEAAAAASAQPWGVAAVAPRSQSIVDTMRAQDCLYTVTDRAPGEPRPRVVGSIVEALSMHRDSARIHDLVSEPDVSVITLTVTEKAYFRRAGNGRLDTRAPEVAVDLVTTGTPRTVVGALAHALATRYRRNGAPISVVSCDNITANGSALHTVVRDFVEASLWPDREPLLDWLATSVAFPATIVDRIVPATTAGDQAAASTALGLSDAVPVVAEPYRQWILEDSFAADRPPWELDGALFVPDVAPHQLRKLRLLNGTHSALAYVGSAAGFVTVADVLRSEWGERFVRRFCAEMATTLPGSNVAAYVDELVERFRNPAMQHQLRQIGSDGSLKLPERWFGALRSILAQSKSAPLLELAMAAWVRTTGPYEETGMTDPSDAVLADCWRGARDAVDVVRRLLGALGAPDLAGHTDFVSAIGAHLPALTAGRIEV